MAGALWRPIDDMTDRLVVQVTQLAHAADMPLPRYQTEHSAGMDLYASVTEGLVLERGQWALIPTGIAVAIPDGYEGQVRPRSGLALKHGIGMLNGPGTIDADYRGEIGVILFNFGADPFAISRGDRIAQLIFARIARAELRKVESLPETARGSGGFGHTGIR